MLKRALALLAALVAMATVMAITIAPARAGQYEFLPVPSVTIYPGDLITEEMLADGRFPFGTSAKYPAIGKVEALVGKVARRTLLPGRLIARNHVAEPELIARGTIVPARYESGGLVISASVLALQSGALNAVIQVRNVDSGKVIIGTVREDGSVLIGGQ